jgi:CheY-like chemotaxis protein
MTNSCLLIDDDSDDHDIFALALKKVDRHINCIMVNDGIEGLQLLKGNSSLTPGYIFLDINMPRMNGIECLVELKKLNQLKHTKIIMYSTTEDSNIVKKTHELGAAAFLVKPPSIKALAQALTDIFQS